MSTLTLPLTLGCQYVFLALQTALLREAMLPCACVTLAPVESMHGMLHSPALVSMHNFELKFSPAASFFHGQYGHIL